MNKFLTLILISFVSLSVTAQEAADKKVQAGLVAGFGLNFQKMGTKKIKADGVGNDLVLGMNANFSFTETIGLNAGIEFDFETIKYTAVENIYYNYNDANIQTNEETVGDANELYRLESRVQKPVYLSIPTMLLFRTKFIGYFRYFGKFGLRNSFLLKTTINDKGFNYTADVNPVVEESIPGAVTAADNANMSAKSEMFFFKSAVGASAGAEWNFVGSTCLVAEVGYYYGFTPLHTKRKAEKSYLYTVNSLGNEKSYFSNQATQGQLMFKVSVLF